MRGDERLEVSLLLRIGRIGEAIENRGESLLLLVGERQVDGSGSLAAGWQSGGIHVAIETQMRMRAANRRLSPPYHSAAGWGTSRFNATHRNERCRRATQGGDSTVAPIY